jgi:hypothetical protein
MLGKPGDECEGLNGNSMGLQQRCIEHLFRRIEELRKDRHKPAEFTVKVTFVEIYNEQFIDLVGLL